MATTLEVKFFNSFWLKKVVKNGDTTPSWPGLPWDPQFGGSTPVAYPTFPFNSGTPKTGNQNFFVEEARIKGGFNNTTVDLGVRAYAVNDNRDKIDRSHSLIFSGIFNNRTGFNETNVFSVGANIIKDADPINGSIQKLYTEDTNLLVFQENKVSKVLINKNTIYSGEQGADEAMGTTRVLGQLVPYLGEYGISKNPESFAIFGYRKYFTDKNRAAILRLSRDGITEISAYGMRDYFRDYLATISDTYAKNAVSKTLTSPAPTGASITSFSVDSTDCCNIEIGADIEIYSVASNAVATSSKVINVSANAGTTCTIAVDTSIDFSAQAYTSVNFITYRRGELVGAYDVHNQNYVISLQTQPRSTSTDSSTFSTAAFDEGINGWTSFYSFKPAIMDSLKNKFYSFIQSNIYEHYYDNPPVYDTRGKFYGATTPDESSITFIFNPSPSITKNFNTVSYEGASGWEVDYFVSDYEGIDPNIPFATPFSYSNSNQYRDSTNAIRSYDEGKYATNGITYYAGFNRKENRYVANLVSASTARPGEIIFGSQMSGIKGYLATVKLSIDTTTDPGGMKELFAVGSNYVLSSR